jgi:hypothetical protein
MVTNPHLTMLRVQVAGAVEAAPAPEQVMHQVMYQVSRALAGRSWVANVAIVRVASQR